MGFPLAETSPRRAQDQPRQPRVLLLGNYRPTLAVARALAPLGYRVVVAGRGGEGVAEYSRHAEAVVSISKEEVGATSWWRDPAVLSRMGIDIVLPVKEIHVRQIAENLESPSPKFLWATPAAAVVRACLDKTALYERCNELGVPTERFVAATNRDLLRVVSAIGLPCVIRPKDSAHRIAGEKAIIVDAMAQLDAFSKDLSADAEIIVQKKANGARENLYFAAARGALVGVCQAHIARTDRLDGSGLAVEGTTVEPDARLVAWTQSLTRSLGYTGIGCAQFLMDDSGEAAFLEINPRIAGNHAIAEAAGLPLARLSIELAMSADYNHPMIVGRKGIRFAWTYGDLRGFREAWRAGKLTLGSAALWAGRIVTAGLTANLHMTLSLSDPLPTLALLGRQLGVGHWFENESAPATLEHMIQR